MLLNVSRSGSSKGRLRFTSLVMGLKKGLESKVEKGKGVGEASRRRMVKEWKGWTVGEKRVADREDSVAEKRWVRRS